MQLYPGWSARDNYGYGTKKKKRKKERTPEITSLGGRRNILWNKKDYKSILIEQLLVYHAKEGFFHGSRLVFLL